MPSTVRFHRVLRAPPERVYRAFLDADAKAKWLPPNGFTGKVHHLDAKVGGTYRMTFTNFSTGHGHSFGGTFVELVSNERIRHTDTFDDANLPGANPGPRLAARAPAEFGQRAMQVDAPARSVPLLLHDPALLLRRQTKGIVGPFARGGGSGKLNVDYR